MMYEKSIILVLLIVAIFFSCEKDKTDDLDITSFENCRGGDIQDSITIGAQLIGNWKWVESQCGFCPDSTPMKADKSVTAVFNEDSTYSVIEESEVSFEGNWEVRSASYGFFIDLDPGISTYLSGSLRICSDQLLSDARAWDGPANLFIRAE